MSEGWFGRAVKVSSAIGKVTFLEIIRDKILYNIVLFAILLLGVGFLASRLSFVRPDRIVMDFGLTALNICCSMIGILVGASQLTREFERRTIHMALSRPITRVHFIVGKFTGIVSVIFLNWLLLSGAFLLILSFSGDGLAGNFHFTLVWALFCIFLQASVLSCLGLLFSSFSTTSLSAMCAIGLYLIGINMSQIRLVATRVRNPFGLFCLNTISTVFPNFEYFNLGTKVTYGLPVTTSFGILGVTYAVGLCAMSLALAGYFVDRKEV